MEKEELVIECGRLHQAVSKANYKIQYLEKKLKEKSSRIRTLSQHVSDKEKSRQKLQSIVDSLRDVGNISDETAARLKVNFI